jgi:U3 small nucleolar RNA-associated protein 14
MARTLKKSSSGKPRPSSRRENPAGFFTKRHSRKSKTPNVSDLYEYQPETVRRSKVALELDRREAAEVGHGGSESDREEPRAWLVGERGDDERVDSGDDEEIDSDAAFEESDEERFAGFNFSQKVSLS